MGSIEKFEAIIIVVIVTLLVAIVMADSNSPKIELTKSEWTCTESKRVTGLVMAGSTPVHRTHNVCVKYEKK